MKNKIQAVSALIIGIALLSNAAIAVPITYNINHSVGAFGTVAGTLQTDGTIGTLGAANILDWNLIVNGDANTATVGYLRGPGSGGNSTLQFFNGSGLTASFDGLLNSLSFNFDTPPLYIFQIRTTEPQPNVVWQMQGGIPFQDEMVRELFVEGSPIQQFLFRGPVSVLLGTAAAPTPVSEPTTNALLLAGLCLMFLRQRRLRQRA